MIVDAHTDVLSKYLINSNINFYQDNNELSVNFPNMIKGGIDVQIFAIFVGDCKFKYLSSLQSIDDFYEKIIKFSNEIQLATTYKDIELGLEIKKKSALLSLEGADAIEGDLGKLRNLYRLGVRAMGLTWNTSNEVADGILDNRGIGLTKFGEEVVVEMNRLGMIIDVSHLSEKSFWDVLDLSKSPIMASHSNVKSICNHPRNLTDEQIIAIVRNNGIIGVTFVRDFTCKENPTIDSLLLHIEYILELGGINNIGLGSDFDGAITLIGLEDASKLYNLVNALYQKFDSNHVSLILKNNWLSYFKKILV